MDLNLSWSIELFEECKKKNINLQYASSASVYGNRHKEDGPFKETDICKPLNYYAMSKYLFEEYVKKSEYDIIVQGFRYFNVYGPNEEHKGSQASPYTQFAKQVKETGIIKVFKGSEQCLRDFIHVDEVINTQLKMINYADSGIYNVGTGKTISFLEVARYIALTLNAKIEIIPFPDHLKQHYQYYTEADISKLESIVSVYG
jgi:ADP-L-glycero-D-manno-heptose 6-epimerase